MNLKSDLFVVGEIYNRQADIHDKYKGQERSGIVTPSTIPVVFIFTGDSGEAFGYADTFHDDGTFWYTGEGQVGDMQMIRGNAAIRDHAKNGKTLLVFESAPGKRVRYLGEAEYLSHHEEIRPDRNKTNRKAFVFHLGFIPKGTDRPSPEQPDEADLSERLPQDLTLDQLRVLALKGVRPNEPDSQKRLVNVKRRAEAVKRYALKRANGTCEGCENPAPFKNIKKAPFLEVHHLFRLGDGGPDHPDHVIALCPNCHRRVHYSIDAKSFNADLVLKLK